MYLNLAYIFIGFVWCIHACSVSRLCLTLLTPWTVARQAPLFMSFSRQEYQSGLPFPHFGSCILIKLGFPGGASGKEPACQCRRCTRLRFDPWVGKIPWERAWQPTLVFLRGESQGQRGLAGYSPWGCRRVGQD